MAISLTLEACFVPRLDQEQFDALIARVRQGNAEAAAELVKLYEPQIRRHVRLRLTDPQLRRTLDSTDVCQSVFGNFFVKTAMGQIDFDRPGQLMRLLSQMARNKVIDRHRREKARRPENGNGYGRFEYNSQEPSAKSESPSQILECQELAALVKTKLTDEENKIAEMRRQGISWQDIGSELNQSGDALRKRLARSCQRVLQELGLDDHNES